MKLQVHYARDFEGTDYVEIGPGKYTGKHWEPGFIFINEDVFSAAEGIVRVHFPEYDPYGMNDIPEPACHTIIAHWQRAAQTILAKSETVNEQLCLSDYRHQEIEAAEIARFLQELANACRAFAQKASSFCILGL